MLYLQQKGYHFRLKDSFVSAFYLPNEMLIINGYICFSPSLPVYERKK